MIERKTFVTSLLFAVVPISVTGPVSNLGCRSLHHEESEELTLSWAVPVSHQGLSRGGWQLWRVCVAPVLVAHPCPFGANRRARARVAFPPL